MPSANSDNVAGHRLKYENLKAHFSEEDVNRHFVGGSDPVYTGYMELELIRRFRSTDDIFLVDIGCGIGRLTRHMIHQPIKGYLGLDIIPEIMAEAEDIAKGNEKFSFAIANDCKIPLEDSSADVVVAFSVITHLMDEEVYDYIKEARRVLAKGGVALFSFLDFHYPRHREDFFRHATHHRHGHGDVLKFTTKNILGTMAAESGFGSVEFVDGLTEIPASGLGSPVIEDGAFPPFVQSGQSVCVMKAW